MELIQAHAILEANHLISDPRWTAGVAMYWGEGGKASRRLSMANSDPAALWLFMSLTSEYLPPESGWRAKLNIHADNNEPMARRWWADQLKLDLTDFTKSFVKPDRTGHRKNHLPYGVCIVTKRKSADAHLKTMAWIEFLQAELGGKILSGRWRNWQRS